MVLLSGLLCARMEQSLVHLYPYLTRSMSFVTLFFQVGHSFPANVLSLALPSLYLHRAKKGQWVIGSYSGKFIFGKELCLT